MMIVKDNMIGDVKECLRCFRVGMEARRISAGHFVKES